MVGRPQLGLKAQHSTKPKKAQNRCHSTFPWSHRMIHEASWSGTRTKRSVSSSRFQCIQDHLIPAPYEGDIAETVLGCWLNPRWTWKPSWSRLVTWRWGRFVHVQRGDVLITSQRYGRRRPEREPGIRKWTTWSPTNVVELTEVPNFILEELKLTNFIDSTKGKPRCIILF